MSSDDVTRVRSVVDLPDDALQCQAIGHRWDPGPLIDAPGWGGTAWAVRLTCGCGRWRTDIVGPDTLELFSRSYGGGVLVAEGADRDRASARAEWGRRARARAAGLVTLAGAEVSRSRGRRRSS